MTKRELQALCLATWCGLAAASGCIAEQKPRGAEQEPRYATVYEPLHYNGYPVYYDAWGFPFYHSDGAVHYVPRDDAQYDVLVNRFRHHRR
jgi:hypothetical protein